ncbi:MAG TPA: metallopeptidase TldD-related protein, partial [Bryobacteraceae bacterium]|nr:metallopeptidase TldD-related protein [Bryobacteraceae bacterium]
SYAVDDIHVWSASAMLGGLIASDDRGFRVPEVHIRVGDYSFDNTNFLAPGLNQRSGARGFPLEGEAAAVRQYLWLASDSAYKSSLQAIARKRASLRSLTVRDQLPDFAKAPPFQLVRDPVSVAFNLNEWTERARKVSAVFNAYPGLRSSLVEWSALDVLHRFVSSEGTAIQVPNALGAVQIRASAQAADGMIVRDIDTFYTQDIRRMFPEQELTSAARSLGENVTKLAAAPMGDNYSGPILFEGVSAPQLLAQLLGRNLHIARKPVSTAGPANQIVPTELEGRRGVRIMPEFFDVTDDPSLPLLGHEEVDDEGVPDRKVALVERGVLKDFLRTRDPVRGYADSNGHARLSGGPGGEMPEPTNLIVKASEQSSLTGLRKKMLDLCQQRGLPYGIVIRKMDFPSSASFDEARRLVAGSASAGSMRPISIPTYVYRLYADGHEELIRGVRLRGLNARSLKDILAAGNDLNTLNYLENEIPFALLGAGGNAAGVSVMAPSLLVDDIDLTRMDEDFPKLPIVPSPPTEKSQELSANAKTTVR